jgi:hypothetical protein
MPESGKVGSKQGTIGVTVEYPLHVVDYRHQLIIPLWWSRCRHPIVRLGGEVHRLIPNGFLNSTGACEVKVLHLLLHGSAPRTDSGMEVEDVDGRLVTSSADEQVD